MSLGPLMLDLEGAQLTPEEQDLLRHPLVGGVILFSRNYHAPPQLLELTEQVHRLRTPRLLVAVDQEGGRVQRLRSALIRLPAPGRIGTVFDRDPKQGRSLAEACGWVMALELGWVGVDFSFAPVLDLARGKSTVIGDRAFHRHPEAVAELGRSFMRGMRRAGMAAVGKHFPGHGSVEADSHVASPVDARPLETLRFEDMLAFERMIHYGLPAVMPAHVVYPKVDARPAGFSHYWLQSVLRQQLRFSGAVFSDDISMAGAAVAGDLVARAQTALAAGCDMVLVCNDRAGAINIFERLKVRPDPVAGIRLARMHRHECANREDVIATSDYQAAVNALTTLEREPELDLGDDNLS